MQIEKYTFLFIHMILMDIAHIPVSYVLLLQ